jgi:hypothetical protein
MMVRLLLNLACCALDLLHRNWRKFRFHGGGVVREVQCLKSIIHRRFHF